MRKSSLYPRRDEGPDPEHFQYALEMKLRIAFVLSRSKESFMELNKPDAPASCTAVCDALERGLKWRSQIIMVWVGSMLYQRG